MSPFVVCTNDENPLNVRGSVCSNTFVVVLTTLVHPLTSEDCLNVFPTNTKISSSYVKEVNGMVYLEVKRRYSLSYYIIFSWIFSLWLDYKSKTVSFPNTSVHIWFVRFDNRTLFSEDYKRKGNRIVTGSNFLDQVSLKVWSLF